jgi:cyclohexa-1,5-dienecarbonyl-CoA hydratase
MPAIRISVEARTARITLDRPPVNVIDRGVAEELHAALDEVAARADLTAVLLRAEGRMFSAGVDVPGHLPPEGAALLHAFDRVCSRLGSLEIPTVCAVQGAALGGGAELTLMCDVVLMAEGGSIGFPEIRLGVLPPVAAVALPRMIPAHLAWEMLLTGRTLDAQEARGAGLANRVVPAASLADAVEESLATFDALSPSSLRHAKRVMSMSRVRPTALEIDEAERWYVEHLMHSPDAIEGLKSFVEKRPPRWGG